MFKSFPYDRWSEEIGDFWTWGGHNSIGTYIFTVLGCVLTLASLIGWFWLEKRKLDQRAVALRTAGTFRTSTPEPPAV